MTVEAPLNERKCDECGQVTMTEHWQEVEFCAGCGVEFGEAESITGNASSLGFR